MTDAARYRDEIDALRLENVLSCTKVVLTRLP
jgi:hypothetical protein